MRKTFGLIGILAGLALASEMTLRFGVGLGDPPLARLDPATEYELVPAAAYRRWGNTITVNAFGMRTRDHSALPVQGERRVLLIGDSVVYGTNFLDQTETIAAVLEDKLATSVNLSGCTVLALPMAASSWGPENQAAFLAREGTFGAEAAAIVLSAHDLYDVMDVRPDILPYRLTGSRTAIGDAFEIALERFWQPQRTDIPLPPEQRAARSLVALDAMLAQLEVAGIRPLIVYHPTAPERTGEVQAPENERFRNWAEAHRLPFLDLGVAIAEQDGYRDTIHPDASGASRIAAALSEAIAASLQNCSVPGALAPP